jgi:predicted transcriptional regulator of viral defense system
MNGHTACYLTISISYEPPARDKGGLDIFSSSIRITIRAAQFGELFKKMYWHLSIPSGVFVNSLEFLSRIQKIEVPLFTTRELAALFGFSEHSVGNYFAQLKSQNLVERVSRGKWVLRCGKLDVLQAADFLTAPKESYISLQSALFYHGLIEQIPSRIYAVTLDRTKAIENPLGVFSFHHCHPDFFTGYEY